MNEKYTLSQLAAIYNVYKDLSDFKTVNCCTCGKSIHINSFEDCYALWGHYIARSQSRKLIYHPLNSHAQCPTCNIYFSDQNTIEQRYDNYMKYRYGNDIKNRLLHSEEKSEEYYENFYITGLLNLVYKFPELADIVVNTDTGEIKNVKEILVSQNTVEKQFFTFSLTYKQDLDSLSKVLHSDFIEYSRY